MKLPDNIDRIDVEKTTHSEFIDKYEMPYKPCILVNSQKEWLAKEKWTLDKLEKKFRNKMFKVGEDDEGYSVKLKMKYYRRYAESNIDDSPLYLFESSFGEHQKKRRILEHYSVPEYFEEDLFQHAGEKKTSASQMVRDWPKKIRNWHSHRSSRDKCVECRGGGPQTLVSFSHADTQGIIESEASRRRQTDG